MTDEILIHKYLDKNYKVTTNTSDFEVLDLINGKSMTPHDFIKCFNTTFGDFTSVSDETSIDIFYRWFNFKKREITKKIMDNFDEMAVILGKYNWQVIWIGHGPITKRQFLDRFKDDSDLHDDFILKMYDDWYDEKVIQSSEKIMNTISTGLDDVREKALLITKPK